METIYSSKYLKTTFELENNLIIQDWLLSPKTLEEFKKEMLEFVFLYKKQKAKHLLWLQKNFNLELDISTQLWLEENVNIPLLKNGIKKTAFVISKNLYAHLSIINSFDRLNSCLEPKHFVTEKKAKDWLFEEQNIFIRNKTKKLLFDGLDNEGNLIIRMPSDDIKQTLKSLNKVIEEEKYKLLNNYKFNLLTSREKEILTCIKECGNQNKIAEKLFISIHTVRTHYKNIKLKLDFQNNSEFLTFVNSYSF